MYPLFGMTTRVRSPAAVTLYAKGWLKLARTPPPFAAQLSANSRQMADGVVLAEEARGAKLHTDAKSDQQRSGPAGELWGRPANVGGRSKGAGTRPPALEEYPP